MAVSTITGYGHNVSHIDTEYGTRLHPLNIEIDFAITVTTVSYLGHHIGQRSSDPSGRAVLGLFYARWSQDTWTHVRTMDHTGGIIQ